MSWKIQVGKVNNTKILVFRKPSEIGFYSVDGEKECHDDNHQMKWIHKPPTGWDASLIPGLYWDLNAGYPQTIKKDWETKTKMTHVLKWILHHQEIIQRAFLSPKSNDSKIDFVCSRGLLTKICATPYDSKKEWSFCASKFKSVIYMCLFETDRQVSERINETERYKEMITWGAKFEQYMTSDAPNSKPNTSIPVNENEAYYVVLKGQMNGYTLLYTAEVDGKDPDVPQDHLSCNEQLKSTDCYIELKTAKNNADRGRYFRQKLLSWWLQSFLAGIPKIVCGVRDEDGMIEKLKTYYVEDIPEIARNQEYSWDKDTCLKFCREMLHFVKECVKEEDSETVYKFWYELDSPYVYCDKLVHPGEYKILPEWFTAEPENENFA